MPHAKATDLVLPFLRHRPAAIRTAVRRLHLDADVPLYVDPYAITKDPSALAAECHNAIVSYFQALLDAVKHQDAQRVGVEHLFKR